MLMLCLGLALALCGCGKQEERTTSSDIDDATEVLTDVPKTEPEETLSVELGDDVTLDLVLVRPGSFLMGSDEDGFDEKPARRVTITKSFYMGKFEVTQEQWRVVMGANPSHFKGDKNPVEMVGWDNCQTFLKKLNEKVPGHSFRLPAEAEWEYACRAGSTSIFCYGNDEGDLEDYAWYRGGSGDRTHPVGEKKPNAWGLYDMHGNVWEWCQDYYGKYPAEEQSDPTGPTSGGLRVLRGGAWVETSTYCHSTHRDKSWPGDHFISHGLRVVCEVGVD